MNITELQLKKIMPLSTAHNRDLFLEPLNIAINEWFINTPLRLAAFIAQIAHESSSLYYTAEIASGSAYEKRKDLGNLCKEALTAAHAHGSTTGRFYKG